MLLDLSSYLTTFERSASPYVDVVELINNPCYFLIIFVGLYLRARIFVLKDSLDSLDFCALRKEVSASARIAALPYTCRKAPHLRLNRTS